MEAKLWFCLTGSLTSCIPMHGASLPAVEMTAEAKGESWKELDMYKHHTVALMQLSKQPTKATVALFLSVMNKNKSRFLLGVPKYVNTQRTEVVFPLISTSTGNFTIQVVMHVSELGSVWGFLIWLKVVSALLGTVGIAFSIFWAVYFLL